MQDYLSINETAAFFRVNRSTVYRWTEAGTLPKPLKIGQRVLYSRAKIKDLVGRLEGSE